MRILNIFELDGYVIVVCFGLYLLYRLIKKLMELIELKIDTQIKLTDWSVIAFLIFLLVMFGFLKSNELIELAKAIRG